MSVFRWFDSSLLTALVFLAEDLLRLGGVALTGVVSLSDYRIVRWVGAW